MKTKVFLGLVLSVMVLPLSAQNYVVTPASANIEWHGEKVTGEHNGNIELKSGEFKVKNNKIASGTFIIDMASMTNIDIKDEGMRNKLMGHLKSDDFFGVETYPTSKLVVTKSTAFVDGVAEVTGNLTIKKNTHPVTFKVTKNGDKFTTSLVIDRTLYDVRYGSGKFFENLGDKTIYDDFDLKINFTATQQ